MFLDNTVFVVGAGASAEFGFPVGWTLMQEIKKGAELISNRRGDIQNHAVGRAIRHRHRSDQRAFRGCVDAAAEIFQGGQFTSSIDEFIDRNNENPHIAEVGKLFISHEIAKAEASSTLAVDAGYIFNDINWEVNEQTWLPSFIRELFRGIRIGDVDRIGANITIISFNYDRSVEFALTSAIVKTFGVSRHRASEIVNKLNILHPYGTLGQLPTLSHYPEPGSVPFGPDLSKYDLYAMSLSLLTWSETVEDETVVETMKMAIAEASNIIFLGFGFAEQNMRLLKSNPVKIGNLGKPVYATGKGIARQEYARLKQKISSLYVLPDEYSNAKVQIEEGATCCELLRTNIRNITP